MTDIATIREKYPQYSDMSDEQVARGFHTKFYSDMDYEAFSQKIGLTPQPRDPEKLNDRIAGGLRDFADDNVFPDGAAETAIDGITRGAAAVIDDPVQALKTVGGVIKDSAVGIGSIPANIANAVGGVGLALRDKAAGDDDGAAFHTRRALDKGTQAAVSGLEVSTLGLGGLGGRAARGAVRRPVASQIEQDFARSGVDPSIATVSNSKIPAQAAQQISENLIAGGAARKNITKQMGQAESRKNAIADSLDAGADTSVAGETIIAGVSAHNTQAGKLYDRAFSKIDVGRSAPRSNQTLGKIEDELRKFDNEELQQMFEPATFKMLKKQLSGGGDISIRDLRQLRTEVRLAKAKPKINATQDDTALIKLERALSDDLYEAVGATSGRDAALRLKAADRYYAKTKTRVENALKPFSKVNQTPEGAFAAIRAAMNGQTTSRGRGDLKQLVELKKALNPEDLKTVQAGIFRDLGRTTEGADFSPSHFLSQWNKFGSAQKDVVFGKGGARQDMDALVNVIERLDRLPGAANVSKSGVSVTNAASFVGIANPVTFKVTAAGLGAANATGRLMTNPRYVKALRGLAEAEYAVERSKGAAGAIARLAAAKRNALAAVTAIEATDNALRADLAPFKEAINDNFQFQRLQEQP